MDKNKLLVVIGLSLMAFPVFLTPTFYYFQNPSTISKETLAVASAKCAYNGTTLHDTTQHQYNGLNNMKSIRGPAPFSDSYSVTCDNGALFRFDAKWKDALTDQVKTDKIMAPEKK